MKLRESGMPEEAYWESLFDVGLILSRMGIDGELGDVVELGCGYGTFTIPAAQRISGLLRAYDIDSDMVARTRNRTKEAAIENIACFRRDVFADGFDVAIGSQDACLLFNILHCEEPVGLLTEAARVLRSGGHVLVIHWRHDPQTPRGPNLDIRPRPEMIVDWGRKTGLLVPEDTVIDLPPWHYGLRFRRAIRILFLCTGNSCRSQMAEGWARHLKSDVIEPYSAGIETHGLNPLAVQVMAEAGVDISFQRSKHVDEVKDIAFDYVVTVCGHANEHCPMFPGKTRVIHVGFDDPPALAKGVVDEREVLNIYRRVRDDVRQYVESLPESFRPQ